MITTTKRSCSNCVSCVQYSETSYYCQKHGKSIYSMTPCADFTLKVTVIDDDVLVASDDGGEAL